MSRPTNKLARQLQARRILRRRARAIGCEPAAVRHTGSIRIDRKGTEARKGFSQHGSGYTRRSNYALAPSAVASRRGITEHVNAREARQLL